MTEETLMRAIAGKTKLMQHGKEVKLSLSPSQRVLFDEAIQNGFVIRKGRPNLNNAYFYWCDAKNQPYVFIDPRRKFASVYLDFITTDRQLHPDATEGMAEILRPHIELPAWCNYGGVRIGSDRIRIESAEKVAKAMLVYANSNAISNDEASKLRR